MTVIAMTREMGSLGKDVAAGLAEEMGLELVHHELVERNLAERLQLGESTVHRFLEGKSSLWERWKIDSTRLSRYTAEEILELTTRGNVLIRGWGATQLLRDVPNVVCVRVCAPMPKRVAVMLERLGIADAEQAQREIERNDDDHSRAIQRQFGIDWRDPIHYDMVLNTGSVSVETCVALIRRFAEDRERGESDATRAALHAKLVEARVRTLLDTHVGDMPIGSSLEIAVADGTVTLSGVAGGSTKLPEVIEKIQEIEGVTSVRNDVLRVPLRYGP